MTFVLWAAAASVPIGLASGWLVSQRVALFTSPAGGWPHARTRARPRTRWRLEHPGLVAAMVAGSLALSLTHPREDWIGLSRLLLLWCAALPLAWIDLRTQLVDTSWLVGALALRLTAVALLERPQLLSMLGGLLIAAGFFHILDLVYETLRHRRGLGDGDPAVAGLMGAFVGVEGVLPLVGLAAVTGLVGGALWLLASRRGWSDPIPFAPFLVLAGLIVALAQTHRWGLWPVLAY